jgi:hypothetical protein
MTWLRGLARTCLAGVDVVYRRRHRLRPIGPMLYVARARYPGPAMTFSDGTRLAPGDAYGALHFDNSRIAALGEGSRVRTGVRFARLLRDSLSHLADATREDPALRDLPAFHGVTWIRDHGGQVGFVSEPLPAGLRRRLLSAHFRMMRWVFAPSMHAAGSDAPEPRMFWLTRADLLSSFGRSRR